MPTARELISRSWYLSGLESRELQSISGDREAVGLALLNSIFDVAQADTNLLPYYSYKPALFNTVVNQEEYFIPNCAQIDAVSFNLNDVRFHIKPQKKNRYFGSSRVNNLDSLPFTLAWLRSNGGSSLYFYPLPSEIFEINVFGKFYLSNVTLDTELSDELDNFYNEYLRYMLADYMAQEYGIELPPRSEKRLRQLIKIMKNMTPIDTEVRTAGLNKGGASLPPQVLSLYTGWMP